MYGRIVSVAERTRGSELKQAHAAGATTLVLEDTLDFEEPDEGSTVTVRMLFGGEQEFAFVTALDDDLGTMSLATGLSKAYGEGARIEVYPIAKVRVAEIRLEDAEEQGETLDTVVPHALYDRIDTGIRAQGEAVALVETEDDWMVGDVMGDEPQADGKFIRAGTIVAEKLKVDRLSAVSANLGNITAGTIDSVRITGGIIRTSDTGSRIVMEDTAKDRIKFFDTDGNIRAQLRVGEAGSGKSIILDPVAASANFIVADAGIEVDNDSTIKGTLQIGSSTGFSTKNRIDLRATGGIIGIPPAGTARIHYRSDLTGANELRVAFPNGTVKTINNDA